MYITNRKQRSRPPLVERTPSATSRRHYDDRTSRHYDRLRIQNELDNLFDSWSLNDNDDNDDNDQNDDFPSTLPATLLMESPQRSSTIELEHIMDPSFDPIHDRVDTDVYLESVVVSNSQHDDHDDDFHSAIDDCNDQQTSEARTSLQQRDIEDLLQPLVDQEKDDDDDDDINDDLQDEERGKQKEQQEGVKLNDETYEHQNSRVDHIHSTDKVKSTTPPQQSQSQPLPPSTTNQIIQEPLPTPPSSPPQAPQQQTQESIIDGFSILQEESSPQRQMIISYDKDNQFHKSKTSSGMNDDHPPELLMLSMDSSMTHSEDTMLTCKSQLSYEESHTITPSIAFFLGANKQELNHEGLSIANESHMYNRLSSISPMSTSRKYLSSSSLGLSSDDVTAIGHSKGSSKYTVETPRILELREKKRLMERVHEIRYNRFPALIEVDKNSIYSSNNA